ncbi:MAG: aminotransferase class I/II-fold pyridoxal phosphate-dependent enzyme [Treponema sp.]|nr:aminotransferase class I/II-fold pyridoxal phosphate-dependent enzyme [Treponema sp.]
MKDYGKGGAPLDTILDCSLGVNPAPLPSQVMLALQNIDQHAIKQYPHDETVLEKIALYYRNKGISWLSAGHMFLGDGSLDILRSLNFLCLTYGKRVLGQGPQFTAYLDHVNCLGAHFEYYPMSKGNNYKFEAENYLNRMTSNHDLFIVENPNNPTGQVAALADIDSIAARAASYNKILIVDEAYGDYMPIENSAINLIPTYPNVVVTRTFSKAFGMAGIRMGYIITSSGQTSDTLIQFRKVENQFNCNGIARILGMAFLESDAKIPDRDQIAANEPPRGKPRGIWNVGQFLDRRLVREEIYNTVWFNTKFL